MRTSLLNAPRQLVVLATLLLACQIAVPSLAGTFCIETRIYEGANLDPSSEHRILFDNGLVYDLPQIDSRYVTCFDPAQKQITLLDRQKQIQTTLDIDALMKVTARARAAATPQQQAKFGLNAAVQASKRVIGYTIQFGDIEYHTTTQSADDPTAAADYGTFAILASQLNLVRRLGPPPFGRMTLNNYIAQRNELPLETTLTVRSGDQTQEYRSTHKFQAKLTADDVEAIQEVRGMMTLYKSVALKDFQ